MKRKILIITTVPDTFESILKDQPKYLSSKFNINLVSSQPLNKVRKNEEVRCFDVHMYRGISPIRDVFSIFNLLKVIISFKPDIVHSYTPKAGLISMIAAFICRVPVRIHTFTGLIFPTSTSTKKFLLMFFDRLICNLATTIIPEGHGVMNDLIKHNITRKPLSILGNGNIAGVDTHFFCKDKVEEEAVALRTSFAIPNDSFVFCFVGRFTQEKGFYELLEAFEQLSGDVHLILVGAQDARLPLPPLLLEKLKKHARIHFTGFVNDVRPALAASNTLVLPSYREGFPNAPLQAGSMELPCIVTDINGSNEIIIDEINGWLVKPKCSQSLLSGMEKALRCGSIEIKGAQARVLIKSKFERKNYWKVLENFYNSELVKI